MSLSSGVSMRFILVIMVLGVVASSTDAKSRKKLIKDEFSILNKKLTGKSTKPSPPAILAIEIVDPNENKTSNRNSKRTIDSALGYGYQNYGNHHPPPRYEVYRYSQHDIPPYRGPPLRLFRQGIKSHNYDIQQSVEYNIQPNLNQYYQPGTTLFSTVNNQGQVGGLSTHLPQNNHDPQVPVIILRVYPNQLNDPSAILHPNLPQSHPLASQINSIDVQSLLSKYVQNVLTSGDGDEEQNRGYHYDPPAPTYQQEPQHYQQQHVQHDSSLLTHENYPKDTHTRVVFRTDKNQAGISAEPAMLPIAIPPIHGTTTPSKTTFRIHVPDSYSSVEVQTPDMQYGYSMQDQNQASYYYDNNNGSPLQSQGDGNYYYQEQEPTSRYQYQEQVQPQQYVQVQQQQQPLYEPDNSDPQPYNYHTHEKRAQRSKKNSFRRLIPEASGVKEIGRLKLITT